MTTFAVYNESTVSIDSGEGNIFASRLVRDHRFMRTLSKRFGEVRLRRSLYFHHTRSQMTLVWPIVISGNPRTIPYSDWPN